MIKGLAITPPVLGRISIGRVVEKDGKRLPEKDDQFTVTSLVQNRDGWLLHPLDQQLRESDKDDKLRIIPVSLLFNDPDLNLRVEYSAFDRATGRPVCVGNGETCKRRTENGMEEHACPGPDHCPFGQDRQCKPYGRLNVRIQDHDEMGTFIFRTTGYNSIRTLTARLSYYQAVSGGLLACLPLALKLRGKSTTQSYRRAIYYVDLTLREDMTLTGAIAQARETARAREEAGFDQQALDDAARQGFANGLFEESEDEVSAVLEEFFSESVPTPQASPARKPASGLKAKLDQQTTQLHKAGA